MFGIWTAMLWTDSYDFAAGNNEFRGGDAKALKRLLRISTSKTDRLRVRSAVRSLKREIWDPTILPPTYLSVGLPSGRTP
jgi:hypothetical protein